MTKGQASKVAVIYLLAVKVEMAWNITRNQIKNTKKMEFSP